MQAGEAQSYQWNMWVTRELEKLRGSTSCPPDVFPSLCTAYAWDSHKYFCCQCKWSKGLVCLGLILSLEKEE